MSEPTTDLKATLRQDLQDAIRGRDKLRSTTLRMALTAVSTAEVSGTASRQLSEEEVLAVLTKEAKKRREASSAYAEAGRTELADQEDAELAVLETYLPSQLDDAELDRLVTETIAQTGATGMAQMGQVMKAVQAKVAGRADGGRVAAVVKQALQA